MPRSLSLALLAITLLAVGCHRGPKEQRALAWTGSIPAGGWIRIHNISGTIMVRRSPAAQVQVSATERWRRGNPRDVRFARDSTGGDVTICTMYGRGGTCSAHAYRTTARPRWCFWCRNDVSVDYVVTIPSGVKVDASTVNGGLTIDGGSEVMAETVNGKVQVSTLTGPVHAESVNGSIVARVDSLSVPGDVSAETVNGSVTAELPGALNADVEMETVNGRVHAEYPLTAADSSDRHHLRATIGAGGRRVRLETVNGSVTLRKHG
jgi:hypothetical protein